MSSDTDRLQSAARQLIAAGRAFLDVVEEVVDDPERLTTTAATAMKVVKGAVAGLGPLDDDDPWVDAATASGGGEGSEAADIGVDDVDLTDDASDIEGDDADLIGQWTSERSAPSRVRRVSLD